MTVKHKDDHWVPHRSGVWGEEAGGKFFPLHRKGPQRLCELLSQEAAQWLAGHLSPSCHLGSPSSRTDNAEALGLWPPRPPASFF